MGKPIKRKITSILLIVLVINISYSSVNLLEVKGESFFFTLTFKSYNETPYPEYANLIKQHLSRIGINVEVVIEDWGHFLDTLIGTRDFDLTCIGFGGGGTDFYYLPQAAFRENSSLNCFGYDITMDYDSDLGTGLNEWYIKQGDLIMPPDSEDCIQHAWNWANHLQSEILPMKPLFVPQNFVAYWDNLIGYNYSEGLLQSWRHMCWDGLHLGQESASEIIITDNSWSELNPFYSQDQSSKFIIDACLDPLFMIDSDLIIHPHLAKEWNWIDDYTLDIDIRDGIAWPDYGPFTNEYVDVDDIYFTLYCWQEISVRQNSWDWLSDFEKLDDDTIRIYIDGDQDTLELEPNAATLLDLATWIVPEHFLNQTQELDGVTPDVTHLSWDYYSSNVWGTNLFVLNDYNSEETILKINPDCWRLNNSITNEPNSDYYNKNGGNLVGLDTLRIKILDDIQSSHLEFENGKIDLVDVSAFLDKRDQYYTDSTKDLQSDVTNFFNWVGYNMREVRGPIGNRDYAPLEPSITVGLAIRKAISYAINRIEINQIIHYNENVIWDYPNYPTLGIWNNPNIIRYNFDLNKAREYMTKAGYDLGGSISYDNHGRGGFVFIIIIYILLIFGMPILSVILIIYVIVSSLRAHRRLKKEEDEKSEEKINENSEDKG